MISDFAYSMPNCVVGPTYPTVSQGLPGVKASTEVVNENQSS